MSIDTSLKKRRGRNDFPFYILLINRYYILVLFIEQMKLLQVTSAIAILVVLEITFVNSSPLQRLKRSLEPQENLQDDDRMSSYTQSNVAPEQSTGIKSMGGGNNCAPGLWTCLHSNPPGPDDEDYASSGEGLRQGPSRDKRSHPIASGSDENSNTELTEESGNDCPPGIWVCGTKKRSVSNKKLRRAIERFF